MLVPSTSKQAETIDQNIDDPNPAVKDSESSWNTTTSTKTATELAYVIMDIDVISVQLVPEKKGLFLKHSEYEVRNNDIFYFMNWYVMLFCMSCVNIVNFLKINWFAYGGSGHS